MEHLKIDDDHVEQVVEEIPIEQDEELNALEKPKKIRRGRKPMSEAQKEALRAGREKAKLNQQRRMLKEREDRLKAEGLIEQKNAKIERRAQVAQTIASIPTTALLGSVISKGSKLVNKGIDKLSSSYNQYKAEKMLPTVQQDHADWAASGRPDGTPQSERKHDYSLFGFNSGSIQKLQDYRRSSVSSATQSNAKQPYSQSLQNSISHMQTRDQSSSFAYSNTHGSNLLNTYNTHQSKNQNSSIFNKSRESIHNLLQRNNQGGIINTTSNNNNSIYNSSQSHQGSQNTYSNNPYSFFNKSNSNSSNISQNNPYNYFYNGGLNSYRYTSL